MGDEKARETDGPAAAAALGLEPHPEGGWYRRLWTASEQVATERGPRAAATAIHYLLAPGERSRWHRVASDELWLWHSGSPLTLVHAAQPDDADGVRGVLGPDHAAGQSLWAAVPAGRWQSAEAEGPLPALLTCVVAPGFTWSDFTLHRG
ncbi:cupin domain-containing protein [Streptomyces capoamus]|uniref:cupin domain-containing protein n=2 Tax=Streptomyces capoamus TaxID=68183 RepID=UPI003393D781